MSATKRNPYQIVVSGAAKGPSVEQGRRMAAVAGQLIVDRGHTLLTGATNGLPYYAALAAKAAGGASIGISPALNRREHIKAYRLPVDAFDTIIMTGNGYMGRDLLLVRSGDAVVMVGGRLGTLNELIIAIEEHKPVGVLLGSGGMTVEVEWVLKAARRGRSNIFFGEDPAKLLDQLEAAIAHKHRRLG